MRQTDKCPGWNSVGDGCQSCTELERTTARQRLPFLCIKVEEGYNRTSSKVYLSL